MKKVGVLIILILISLVVVSAQNTTIDEKARACLENKLGDGCGNSNSVEQLAFSLLAMSHDSGIQGDCKSELLDKQKSDNSYGTIKETALATIALDYIKASTSDEKNYLLSKKRETNLEWYLEVDINGEGKCTITGGASITLKDDKKLSGNTGNCFSLAYDSYWLKINSNCIDDKIEVSCDKDFISTLIFKKPGSNTWHVTSDVQSASSGGKTEHEIDAYCFGDSGCDYEGSLWAALALQTLSEDISPYTPYLTAFAEDNQKFFPDAFLYILTDSNEHLTKIATLQKTEGFWKLDTNQYYDAALALLALTGSEPASSAIAWLEREQGNDGCWNNGNIRDTAFLLWAAYPRTPVTNGGRTEDNCLDFNHYCMSQGECDSVTGQTLLNYYCSGLKICCDTPPEQKTCSEERGLICSSGEDCTGAEISTIDTTKCCLGSCEPEESGCEQQGFDYTCRSSCLDDEQSDIYSCPTGEACCKKQEPGPGFPWWIILLIILIILVALAIIFRNKLRAYLFKVRNKFKKGPVTKSRPIFPPTTAIRRMMPRRPQMMPPTRPIRRIGTQVQRAASKTDKELEDTLKKLKEMSK